MDEIAEQYVNNKYDKFSRKVVKRPGKKLPMSRTRMQYIQRRNLQSGSSGTLTFTEDDINSQMASTIDVSRTSNKKYTGKSKTTTQGKKPSTERWVGSIDDDNQEFDRQFTSRQPKSLKHVESRIQNPRYLHPKTHEHKKRPKEPSHRKTNKADNELKENQNKQLSKTIDSHTEKETIRPYRETKHLGYAEKQHMKYKDKLNFAIWKDIFMKAIKEINEKEKKNNELAAGEVDSYRKKKFLKESERHTEDKEVIRPAVITPTLERPQRIVQNMNKGSYLDRFNKVRGFDNQSEEYASMHSYEQQRPSRRQTDVVRKSDLNSMMINMRS